MASIVISGDIHTKVNEMVNNLLKGKIGISQFIKFLHDNDLKIKVNYVNKDDEPSVIDDFVGDTLRNIFCYKKSEHEDTENYIKDEENDDKEIEDNEYEKPGFNKKSNEVYEKDVKDTVEFAKRLIDDYGDSEEDDIEHAKAVKLFYSLMLLARTYRQKASKGDEKFNIPNFAPENILKFIESLDLPIDKIKAASERGKSTYYKTKIYKSFEEFENKMKDAYRIEDVWNPPKEAPEWFKFVRDKTYAKFHSDEILSQLTGRNVLKEILKFKPNASLREMLDIGDYVEKSLKEHLESLKKSKDFSESAKKVDAKELFENQCRTIVNTIIDEFSPILTGEALKHFEKMYKSYNNTFVKQLKSLYSAVKSAKNDGLTCFIDVKDNVIICNPIENTKKDIEETILNTLTESDSKESSNKKSSTSKKTTSSASAKKVKVSANTSTKSKTDAEKLKEFKGYSDYILLNSPVEDDARDLLLSYAANMDERCKDLYKHLIDLKKRHKSVKLVRHYDENTNFEDLVFVDLID